MAKVYQSIRHYNKNRASRRQSEPLEDRQLKSMEPPSRAVLMRGEEKISDTSSTLEGILTKSGESSTSKFIRRRPSLDSMSILTSGTAVDSHSLGSPTITRHLVEENRRKKPSSEQSVIMSVCTSGTPADAYSLGGPIITRHLRNKYSSEQSVITCGSVDQVGNASITNPNLFENKMPSRTYNDRSENIAKGNQSKAELEMTKKKHIGYFLSRNNPATNWNIKTQPLNNCAPSPDSDESEDRTIRKVLENPRKEFEKIQNRNKLKQENSLREPRRYSLQTSFSSPSAEDLNKNVKYHEITKSSKILRESSIGTLLTSGTEEITETVVENHIGVIKRQTIICPTKKKKSSQKDIKFNPQKMELNILKKEATESSLSLRKIRETSRSLTEIGEDRPTSSQSRRKQVSFSEISKSPENLKNIATEEEALMKSIKEERYEIAQKNVFNELAEYEKKSVDGKGINTSTLIRKDCFHHVIKYAMEQKIIKKCNGVVYSRGIDSIIFHANGGCQSGGYDVAVKSRLFPTKDISFSYFNCEDEHLNWRSVKAEFTKLVRAHRASVPVPSPLLQKKNMIFMRFIGENMSPAPRMVEIDLSLELWTILYSQVMVAIRRLYITARLVHGFLKGDNILVCRSALVENKSFLGLNGEKNVSIQAVLINFDRAVEADDKRSKLMLKHDVERMRFFFTKKGVNTLNEEKSMNFVTAVETNNDSASDHDSTVKSDTTSSSFSSGCPAENDFLNLKNFDPLSSNRTVANFNFDRPRKCKMHGVNNCSQLPGNIGKFDTSIPKKTTSIGNRVNISGTVIYWEARDIASRQKAGKNYSMHYKEEMA